LTDCLLGSIIKSMLPGLGRMVRLLVVLLAGMLVLSSSVLTPSDEVERVRAFTRSIEFDYIQWTLDAIGLKLGQAALGTDGYINSDQRPQVVLDYLDLINQIQQKEGQLSDIYADPNTADPDQASLALRQELEDLYARRKLLQPLTEDVLQEQISQVVASMGLSLGGQPIPPISFHTTPPPYALIVSPRDTIRVDADISVSPDLTVDQMVSLEAQVDQSLDVSSLVVGIGGMGTYPTMVMQTTDLNWLVETVAHEWTHNYLTLRPLGLSYLSDPKLRVMNETTASIAGTEIGSAVIARFYPQFLPPSTTGGSSSGVSRSTIPERTFDYRKEMHITRVAADQMLAEGRIQDAENYMDARRRLFWEHGYHIRKLNQAFFAFHGAYADQPGGASGAEEDPVGAAVRALRAQSSSLADFINRISWMWTFGQLQHAVGTN
jgi:hypothetical protein